MKTLRRRRNALLTPLEIQLQTGGGKPLTEMERKAIPEKLIRFYGIEKPIQLMEDLTSDDLKAAGFVPYCYKTNTKDARTLLFRVEEDSTRLVHQSAPIAPTKDHWQKMGCEFPTIAYEIGYGWEAKWGAVRFPLRNDDDLRRFMNLFDYQRP